MRLVEVALEYGAKAAYRVDYANEVEEAWLDGVAHRRRHLRRLRARGPGPRGAVAAGRVRLRDVEEVNTAEEDILFSLPKEIRAKLKEAGDDSRGLGGRVVKSDISS